MNKFLKVITGVIALGLFGNANAAIISGDHSVNGQSVNLSSLEWLSLDLTANLSYVDLFSTPVDTSGSPTGRFSEDAFKGITGQDVGLGWRLATVNEVNTLLNSIFSPALFSGSNTTVGNSNEARANATASQWFFSNFGNIGGRFQPTFFKYGESEACGSELTLCHAGLFNSGTTTEYQMSDDNDQLDSAVFNSASFLVRTTPVAQDNQVTQVSEPTGLALGTLLLCGLAARVRSKNTQA